MHRTTVCHGKCLASKNNTMKYLEATFIIEGEALVPDLRDTAADMITALDAEAGFESFTQEDGQLTGYVQEELIDREMLDASLSSFPIPGVKVTYSLKPVEDKDWNETWEDNGFEPVFIGDKCVIHDMKHLPATSEGMLDIVVDARMAFGTGTHETTQMMIDQILKSDMRGKRVLDCGCGTGILSVAAAKTGAREVVAYDIDEWSVENTRHNARLNSVDNITVLTGNAEVLSHVSGVFDFVLANINRNILLADMKAMREVMGFGSKLIISGFYQSDADALCQEAQRLGMTFQSSSVSGDWMLLSFSS